MTMLEKAQKVENGTIINELPSKKSSLDLTVLIPGIRTHLWEEVVDSIDAACQKFDYEIIFIGPFPPAASLQPSHVNVRYIRSYDRIPVAMQKATMFGRGGLIFHTTDDSHFFPQSIDQCVKMWYDLEHDTDSHKHVINCRYREEQNRQGYQLPEKFWTAGYHPDLHLPKIDPSWAISVQPLMSRLYFIELGGFNCVFEYSNHCHHDLMFRLQRDGGKIYNSSVEVANADHMPGKTGDHGPIHDAQTLHDEPIFREMYSQSDTSVVIPYGNFEEFEGVWQRRFPKPYDSYVEMMGASDNTKL